MKQSKANFPYTYGDVLTREKAQSNRKEMLNILSILLLIYFVTNWKINQQKTRKIPARKIKYYLRSTILQK